MNKVLCSLLVIAIIGTAQCESFKRVHFDQGKAHFERHLDAATPLGRAGLDSNAINHTTVVAKILPEFLTNNSKEATEKQNVTIYLHSSESGFCSNSEYFVKLDCQNSGTVECRKSSSSFGISAGKMRSNYAYQIKNETATFFTLDNSTAWKLTTKPVVTSSIEISGEKPPKESSYGFIGLGAQGLAKNNFVNSAEAPVFSVSVNSVGKGSVIFGNDTTLIPTNRKDKPLTWNTTENWIGTSSALYARYSNNTGYNTRVYLDLNQQKSSFSSEHYSKVTAGFNLTSYNSTLVYNATLMGPISRHPPVIITIGGSNVTIPVEALFKKIDDPKVPNTYTFMVESVIWEYNYNNTGSSPREEMTIFGTHFLSNFYTVFSIPKGEGLSPSVQLFPIYTAFADTTTSSSGGSGGKFLIGLIAVIGLGAVGFIVFRNKAASKLQEHLNEK